MSSLGRRLLVGGQGEFKENFSHLDQPKRDAPTGFRNDPTPMSKKAVQHHEINPRVGKLCFTVRQMQNGPDL